MMRHFDPPHHLKTVTLVGLGGTGSALARLLARIIYDMKRARLHLPQVRFIDPDKVELKNCGRQTFCVADVGYNKAEILARRFNLGLGLDISWIAQPVDADKHFQESGNLVVGAVDNHIARSELAKVNGLWLDCGNHFSSGQVILGNTDDWQVVKRDLAAKTEMIRYLPNPALLFPQLLTPLSENSPPIESTLSCTELVESGEQHLLVNDWVATVAAQYIFKILHYQPIESFITYLDLTSLNTRSVRICTEEFAPYLAQS